MLEKWAKAVRDRNLPEILADRASDILMFDLPAPALQLKGIEEYRETWTKFFSWSRDSGVFDIDEMNVAAGKDVGFATALMRCAGTEASGTRTELSFRLTVGLRKKSGKWIVEHEHHSIPAE